LQRKLEIFLKFFVSPYLTDAGIVGPLTWNHLRSRCGGVATTASIAPSSATIDIATESEMQQAEPVPISNEREPELEFIPESEPEIPPPPTLDEMETQTVFWPYEPNPSPPEHQCRCANSEFTNVPCHPPSTWHNQHPPRCKVNSFITCLLISRMVMRK